jgi:hypothetical protein
MLRAEGTAGFVEGPLRDLPGEILRLDKRSRCVLTQISFSFAELKVWLGFYFEDDEFTDLIHSQTAVQG